LPQLSATNLDKNIKNYKAIFANLSSTKFFLIKFNRKKSQQFKQSVKAQKNQN
jgi:hypothetical protein